MYLGNATDMNYVYQSSRRPPPPPTSVALDDRFDAMTTEVPTEFPAEWHDDRERGPRHDYEESVSGYRNYVTEMERMLGGEVDLQVTSRRDSTASVTTRRVRRNSPEALRSPGRSKLGMGQFGSMDNVRQVSGRRASMELVEHHVMEDGPQRTISLWREKVAQSSLSGSKADDDVRSEVGNHVHRRVPSGESYGSRRKGEEYARSRTDSVYERSEYMVAMKPTKGGGIPRIPHPPSEIAETAPYAGSHLRQCEEGLLATRRTSAVSNGSGRSSDSRNGQIAVQQQTMSPLRTRTYVPIDGGEVSSVSKATTTSSVELILADCEPSLLHIAPILSELGIYKLEHLQAMNRLSEETRDREVKEQALRRGVTVMEWAILIDKLQSM
ncbi:hypothetical protein EUX98_g4975 [Antrodiella citrinella]|uniref:Uncharacterized protein n=1 Tax=Antrodiella citrinella TaxID=2447956 RepID=A0A4S4MSX7_9APHY|nr:hypothetical protein EUX98_g4975 [Antrodiella citrinella]